MRTVADIAPYMQCSHGYAVCVEFEDAPLLTFNDEAVIMVIGMLHGSVEAMCAQVDYVFQRALSHRSRICTIIETAHPSFRFPDRTLRTIFAHLRKYEKHISSIYFVGLTAILRIGFRFALPFMDANIRSVFHMCTVRQVCDLFASDWLLRRWGGCVDFEACEYIRIRCAAENLSSVDDAPRPFDVENLKRSNAALMEQVDRAWSRDDRAILYKTKAEKRGSGGLFGNRAWKRKTVLLYDDALMYESSGDRKFVSLTDACRLHRDGDCVQLHTPDRNYLFRFNLDAAVGFEMAMRQTPVAVSQDLISST